VHEDTRQQVGRRRAYTERALSLMHEDMYPRVYSPDRYSQSQYIGHTTGTAGPVVRTCTRTAVLRLHEDTYIVQSSYGCRYYMYAWIAMHEYSTGTVYSCRAVLPVPVCTTVDIRTAGTGSAAPLYWY
jgi:hypothetical protein